MSLPSIINTVTPRTMRGCPSLTLPSLRRSLDQTPSNTVRGISSSAIMANLRPAASLNHFPSLTLASMRFESSPSNTVSSSTIRNLIPVADHSQEEACGTSVISETRSCDLPQDLKQQLALAIVYGGKIQDGNYFLGALRGRPLTVKAPRHLPIAKVMDLFALPKVTVQTAEATTGSGIIATLHKRGLSTLASSGISEVTSLKNLLTGALAFAPSNLKNRAPLTGIMQLFDRAVKHKERHDRLKLGAELRSFAQLTQIVKEFTASEGNAAQFTDLFAALQNYRIDSSKLGVSLADLQKIRKESQELLIKPISELKEGHYQEILSMLDKSVAISPQLEEGIEKARDMLPKTWEDRLYRDGMALGEMKKVHGEMLSMLEIFAQSQTKPLEKIRKELLAKHFFHLLKEQPHFKDQAEKLSQELVTPDGMRDFKAKAVNFRVMKSLLTDLNRKVDEVDNLFALMDILQKKDPRWFMLAACENDVASYTPLIRHMESSIRKSQKLLNSTTGGALSEKQASKLERLGSFHKSVNTTLSDTLDALASEYWQHRNAAVQQMIEEVSNSSKLSEQEDLQNWKASIIDPSKAFFAEVKNASQNGKLTSDILAKQDEFLPHFLRVKKTIGNDLGSSGNGILGFLGQMWRKIW